MTTLLLVLALLQDPEALLERLRAGSPAEREAAVQALKALGEAAEQALRKAAGDTDVDLAGRVQWLLRRLEIDRSLTPRLKAVFPGIQDRLVSSDAAWAEALQDALGRTRQPGGLKDADLLPLISRALRVWEPIDRAENLVTAISDRGLREAIPIYVEILFRCPAGLQRGVVAALKELGAEEAVPALVNRLKAPEIRVRVLAITALKVLQAQGAGREIRACLRDPAEEVRLGALAALRILELRDGDASDVRVFLRHEAPEVRLDALHVIGEMGAVGSLTDLREAVRDPVPGVRSAALEALRALDPESAGPCGLDALADADPGVRRTAIEVVGELRFVRAFPALARVATSDPDRELRAQATRQLRGFPEAAPVLRSLARDEEESVRRPALEGLGVIRDPLALPELVAAILEPEVEPILETWADREAAIAHLEPLLQSENNAVRWTAIGILAGLKYATVHPLILAGLRDPGSGTRLFAWHAARHLDGAEIEEARTRPLGDKSEVVRASTEHAFDIHRVRPSTSVLIELLNHEDKGVRLTAITMLWKARASFSSGAIARRLDDVDSEVRERAIAFLSAFGQRGELPRIRKALSDTDGRVRAQAVEALGRLQDRESAEAIGNRLRDEDASVRACALDALGLLDAKEPREEVVRLLVDEDAAVRAAACFLIGTWRTGEQESALLDLLEDGDSRVRTAALEALCRMDARPRAEMLARRLWDPSESTSLHASEVLARLGAREYFVPVARSLGRRDGPNAAAWALTLSRLDPGPAQGDVVRLLESPLVRDRTGAARVLGLTGATASIPALLRASEDPVVSVRVAALEAIGRLGAAEGAAAVRRSLGDPHESARQAAAEAAGSLGDRESVPLLRKRATDRSGPVRWAALDALSKIDAAGSIDLFERGLKDSWSMDLELSIRGLQSASRADLLKAWKPSDHGARNLRAEALCRLGEWEGAIGLSERKAWSVALNAVRSPASWKKLASRPWKGPRLSKRSEVAAEVARQAGLSLEIQPRAESSEPVLLQTRGRIPDLIEVLENAMTHCGWILEEDRIRIVTTLSGQDFWEAWAEERKKK